MDTTLAPICLFTYNRLFETKQTVKALQQNYLAPESELFIFSDGPKNENAKSKIDEVRAFLKTIDGFKKVTIFEAKKNKGLANSIIDGVTQIIQQYGKVIVLEDDLVTSPNFLDFMNQALDFYKSNAKIFSISGFTLGLPSLKQMNSDYYLGYRASSWGWATWLDRWTNVDWMVKDYDSFLKNNTAKLKLNRGGSDMSSMLKNQMSGKIDSWAIRWCYDQSKKDMLTVFPTSSKVESIGFGANATHTKNTSRFDTILDTSLKTNFSFDNAIKINPKLAKEFKAVFSFKNRAKDKLINLFKS